MKIYLAGPTVFYQNATELGRLMKGLCANYGFEGLFPMDNEVKAGPKHEMAHEIYKGNIQMIHDADIVVADLQPFRGYEPDSGTVFEVGYATALGKKVYCYLPTFTPLTEQIPCEFRDGSHVDENGMHVEDFDLPINLMIGSSATLVRGGFEDCLEQVARDMKQEMDTDHDYTPSRG